MEQITIPDNIMQEARRYALCIAGEANRFKDFAIAMLDYMGSDFYPYLKDLYRELSQILFTRAIPQDNLDDVNNIEDEVILSWYNSYKARQKNREEQLQADENFSVICSEPGKPFIYRRGHLLIAINPNSTEICINSVSKHRETLFQIGSASLNSGMLTMGPQSFAVFR